MTQGGVREPQGGATPRTSQQHDPEGCNGAPGWSYRPETSRQYDPEGSEEAPGWSYRPETSRQHDPEGSKGAPGWSLAGTAAITVALDTRHPDIFPTHQDIFSSP